FLVPLFSRLRAPRGARLLAAPAVAPRRLPPWAALPLSTPNLFRARRAPAPGPPRLAASLGPRRASRVRLAALLPLAAPPGPSGFFGSAFLSSPFGPSGFLPAAGLGGSALFSAGGRCFFFSRIGGSSGGLSGPAKPAAVTAAASSSAWQRAVISVPLPSRGP